MADINIGKNIRELRKRAGLKQSEVLARMQSKGVECSVYSFSKIENGIQNPTVSQLMALTEILNCDFNEIFKETEDE